MESRHIESHDAAHPRSRSQTKGPRPLLKHLLQASLGGFGCVVAMVVSMVLLAFVADELAWLWFESVREWGWFPRNWDTPHELIEESLLDIYFPAGGLLSFLSGFLWGWMTSPWWGKKRATVLGWFLLSVGVTVMGVLLFLKRPNGYWPNFAVFLLGGAYGAAVIVAVGFAALRARINDE